MARTTFPVEVLTPEGEVFNDEVEMLSTRTAVGSIGMLANHTPLLAMLDPTELRLYSASRRSSASRRARATCRFGDGALVLVEEAIAPGSSTRPSWRTDGGAPRRPPAGRAGLRGAATRAPRRKRRREAFLHIAQGSGGLSRR